MYRSQKILIVLVLHTCLLLNKCMYAAEDRANIYVSSKKIGAVNRYIFGSSIIGHLEDHERTAKSNVKMGADYGYGVWDPKWKCPVTDTVKYSKEAGIKIFRFIGLAHNWQEGVRTSGENRKYEFGIDEQMTFCSETKSEAIICVQYIFNGTEEIENLISYLNKKADTAFEDGNIKKKDIKSHGGALYKEYILNGSKMNMGNLRALNGHTKPYNVRYIEIGNEIHLALKPEEYASKYLEYYDAIKKIDSSVQVG